MKSSREVIEDAFGCFLQFVVKIQGAQGEIEKVLIGSCGDGILNTISSAMLHVRRLLRVKGGPTGSSLEETLHAYTMESDEYTNSGFGRVCAVIWDDEAVEPEPYQITMKDGKHYITFLTTERTMSVEEYADILVNDASKKSYNDGSNDGSNNASNNASNDASNDASVRLRDSRQTFDAGD